MIRLIAPILLCLALAACETPTLYQAAPRPNAVGYDELRIESGRYRVSFQGGSGAPAQQVEDFVLLRAAQVAVRDGFDWFRVVSRDGTAEPPKTSSAISIGGGSGGYGRGGGVGLGLGTSFDLSGGPRLQRSLEILCGVGPRPTGGPRDGDVYDAHSLITTLEPRAAH